MAKSLLSIFSLFFQDNPIDLKRETFTAKIALAISSLDTAFQHISSLNSSDKNLAVEKGPEPSQAKLEASSQKKSEQDKSFAEYILHLLVALYLEHKMNEELNLDYFTQEQQAIWQEILAEIKAGRIAEAITLMNSLNFNEETKRQLKILYEIWKRYEHKYMDFLFQLISLQHELKVLEQRREKLVKDLKEEIANFEINGEKVFTDKGEMEKFLAECEEEAIIYDKHILDECKKHAPKSYAAIVGLNQDIETLKQQIESDNQELKNINEAKTTNGSGMLFHYTNGSKIQKIRELKERISNKEAQLKEKEDKVNTLLSPFRKSAHKHIVMKVAARSNDPKIKRILTQEQNAAKLIDKIEPTFQNLVSVDKEIKVANNKIKAVNQKQEALVHQVRVDIAKATHDVQWDANLARVQQTTEKEVTQKVAQEVQQAQVVSQDVNVLSQDINVLSQDINVLSQDINLLSQDINVLSQDKDEKKVKDEAVEESEKKGLAKEEEDADMDVFSEFAALDEEPAVKLDEESGKKSVEKPDDDRKKGPRP